MSLAPPVSANTAFTRMSFERQLIVLAGLVVLADWLLYGHRNGISLVLFAAALGIASIVTSINRLRFQACIKAFLLLLFILLPLVENVSPLSIAVVLIGLPVFALKTAGKHSGTVLSHFVAAVIFSIAGTFRLIPDLIKSCSLLARRKRTTLFEGYIAVWIVPLLFGSVFLGLFSFANPLIEKWISEIKFGESFSLNSCLHFAFWLFVASASWPYVRVLRPITPKMSAASATDGETDTIERPANPIFGISAICRSLLVFNLIFAVQTFLDIAYLWGGVELPDGMSYATYAHRGAYLLVLTALLAAVFVLVAIRPGGASEHSPLIRWLVFLWTGQNVLLVISSLLRLDLYVEYYALTYLRVASFIWMILVAIGLILIVVRIARHQSNSWLIQTNLITLGLTIYICCFVNFADFIASYNVAHSSQVAGKGVFLDLHYLLKLGPQAIPALDEYIENQGLELYYRQKIPAWVLSRRNRLATKHLRKMKNWRSWSLRGARLKHYLDNKGIRVSELAEFLIAD